MKWLRKIKRLWMSIFVKRVILVESPPEDTFYDKIVKNNLWLDQ